MPATVIYKILIAQRNGCFLVYREEDPNTNEKVEFETDDIDVLSDKIKELLNTIPKSSIKAIEDIGYQLQILMH